MQMQGPTSGTPISSLVNNQNQYHSQQMPPQYQQTQQSQQSQQSIDYYHNKPRQQVDTAITSLVSDINNSLNTENSSEDKIWRSGKNNDSDSEKQDDKNEQEQDDEDDIDAVLSSGENMLASIPDPIKELGLFVILYWVMSLGFVKKMIGTYVRSINPVDGEVQFVGILAYGLILGSLFLVAKWFLIK